MGQFGGSEWKVFDIAVDVVFFIDIIVNFISAFYRDDHYIIDDYKEIAINYAKSWLVIDVLAVAPFEYLSSS